MAYKATFNLPNKSPTRQVIEFQEPTAQNNYTWYRLYDDGWVEQGGTATSSTENCSATYPVAMADTNYQLQLTFGSAPKSVFNNQYWSTFGWQSKTTTGFSCTVNPSPGVNKQDWQVSGKSTRGTTQQNIMCIKY